MSEDASAMPCEKSGFAERLPKIALGLWHCINHGLKLALSYAVGAVNYVTSRYLSVKN